MHKITLVVDQDTDTDTDLDAVRFASLSLSHLIASLPAIFTRVRFSINNACPAIAEVNIAKMARYTRKQIVTFISIIYIVFATAMAG